MVIPNRLITTAQDAYNYLASIFFADQQLCIVLNLDGKVDEDAFANAVRATLDLEPVLGCRLVVNGDSIHWERRNDLDKIKACAIVNKEKTLADFINEPINACTNPLVITRIQRGKNTDTVCVKVNHSACDAGGLKEYTWLLSNIYNVLKSNGKHSFEPNLVGRRDQSQIFERTKAPRTFAMKEFPSPTWTFPHKKGIQRLHTFRTISKSQLENIKKFAASKKATVNDALLAALYRTFFVLNKTQESKPMIIQVSIDLRRHLPGSRAEAICNLSGALYVALERKMGESFESTLERVATITQKAKADYLGVESAAALEYLLSRGLTGAEKYLAHSAEMSKKYNVTFPLLSNFGILCNYRFGELRTTHGYITSPIMYTGGFMLGATTCNGEMTLSIGYCGEENRKQVDNFLCAYVEELTF